MAFGIGINTEKPQSKELQGELYEVAVKCWFTATGKSMPLMMKIKNQEEEVVTIEHIQVLAVDKQWFAGIVNWKYRCRAILNHHEMEFILLFYPEECQWKLIAEECPMEK